MRHLNIDTDTVELPVLEQEISLAIFAAPSLLQSCDEDKSNAFYRELATAMAAFIRRGGNSDVLGRLLHELSLVEAMADVKRMKSAA